MADLCFNADLTIHAAAGGSDAGSPSRRFDMTAYSGAPMKLKGYRAPVVVDIAGLNVPSQARPILLDHESDVESIAGQSDSIVAVGGKLRVSGEILAGTERVNKVLALAARGFKWQASIGANPEKIEDLRAGDTAIVNGQEVRGPLVIVRQATLREISIVAMGADDRTATVLAATAATLENDDMTAENKTAAAAAPAATAPAITATAATGTPAPAAAPAITADDVAKIVAEAVGKVEAGYKQEIAAMKLDNVREGRPGAPAAHSAPEKSCEVLEAAFCVAAGIPVEDSYGEQTLEAANKHYRRGVGLQELLIEAARMNGYSGRAVVNDDTLPDLLKASFSTASIPGLLSNVANKALLPSFNAIDQSWRKVASTRNVNDFKTYTNYRLTGGMTLERVNDAGEIKHGTFGEMSYTNSADTFGKMVTITRKMFINDDLGALTQLLGRLGRGSALAFNATFWTEFLADNATFYTAGRGNFISGAATALSIDSLTQAEALFFTQTDPDGLPMSIAPQTLLVPSGLFTPATVLMRSTEVRDTTASTKYPTMNPHAGKFEVVQTPYLNTPAIPGGSSTAWFLLAAPGDMSVIEVAFLNGNETPTIEQAQASFDTLGVSMRCYWDFGSKKQEYRGAVKSKGAA